MTPIIGEWYMQVDDLDTRLCCVEADSQQIGLAPGPDGPVSMRVSPRDFATLFRPVPVTYSAGEREAMIRGMIGASNAFYMSATRIGCHPFIEFTGLINEYIKIISRAHAQGIDFTACSIHSGIALPLKDYEAEYLGEKMGCIYGPSFRNPELLRTFLQAVGVDLTQLLPK